MRTENEVQSYCNGGAEVDGVNLESARLLSRYLFHSWKAKESKVSTRTLHFGMPINRPNPNCCARWHVFISISASLLLHPSRHSKLQFHCEDHFTVDAFSVGGRESTHFDFNLVLWISNLISTFSGRYWCPTIVSSSIAAVMIYGYFYCLEIFDRAHVARSAHKIASESNNFLWLTMKGFAWNTFRSPLLSIFRYEGGVPNQITAHCKNATSSSWTVEERLHSRK